MAEAHRFSAHLTGRINNVDFEVVGDGTYDRGLSRGVYQVSTVPDGFDILLLNAFLLMGDPSIHRVIPPAVSLFRGSYEYERTLEFEDGNRITAAVAHTKSDAATRSVFRLEGTSAVPRLDSVNSVVERWLVDDVPGLATEISIEWLAADGQPVRGLIRTLYKLSDTPSPRVRQHLWQRVISHASGSTLEIFQDSVLRVANESPQRAEAEI